MQRARVPAWPLLLCVLLAVLGSASHPGATPDPAAAPDTALARGLDWYRDHTGVPAGTALRASGPITVTGFGAVIDGLDVHGPITVHASNVTIRNSRVRGPIVNPGGWVDLVVDHVEVDLSGVPLGTPAQKYAVNSFWDTTVRHSNLHGMAQGIAFNGGVTVTDSYVHDLRSAGVHSEAILSNGHPAPAAGNTLIARNWLDASAAQGARYVSGALCLYGDYGQIKDVVIDGNHLTGTGYLLYAGAVAGKRFPTPANVTVTNNTFDPTGWGPVYPQALDPASSAAWANNTLVDGTPIPAP